ncbi:MAG: heavy metal translocating P-type ATPase [Candidatus Izemoplasmatales bacterium]
MIQKKYKINGMSCASCSKSIETLLSTTKGVSTVSVNIASETLSIVYDLDLITETKIKSMIDELGYEMVIEEQKIETITFLVVGMSCASCANAIETTIKELTGISEVNLNFANNRLIIKYNPEIIKIGYIQKVINDIGYKLVIEKNSLESDANDITFIKKAKQKVILSAILATLIMSLMLIDMFLTKIPGYIYISAILGFPVIFIFGFDVHKKAFKSIKTKRPNMDVLVSLGSVPPYLIGLLGLFLPITTFIEMATMIMTLHLVGKFLETKAKGKASNAIKKLLEIGSKTAKIIINKEEIEVLTSELVVGDVMIIRPGEKIPMDGLIISGESTIDESLATGESLPVKRGVGENVIGATINKNGIIKVQVTRVGNETFLAQIIKMVEACQGSKVPIQEFADKITGIFVPVILGLTLLTFASFLIFPDFHLMILSIFDGILPWVNQDQSILTLAFVTSTAVLVIACPCALGLGTPTALMVGSGKGAENGILIRSGEAVQTFKDVKAIAFDKTGTLTIGNPKVTDILSENITELLQIAATLENASEHVLAQAIIEKAKEESVNILELDNFESVTGLGITGIINNQEFFLGSTKFFQKMKIDYEKYKFNIEKLEAEAKTVVLVGSKDNTIGVLGIADDLKPHIKSTILQIERMGVKTIMITGDNQKTAEAIAKKAGITSIIASVLPGGKVDEIIKLQNEFGLVAMVGDGINDAPALKQANVGIAFHTGTDIAIEASDITLINEDLESVVKALNLSKAIFSKIKQNYFWAWFYNALAIPFAMLGLLHPMIGALAMSFSSLNVIYNSLRLKKIDLNKRTEVKYEA